MCAKKIINHLVPGRIKKLLQNFWILSESYAQRKTIMLGKCVNEKGNEIPWYTYPAIEYLNGLDFSDMTVLKFGSGASSVWWAGKAGFVLAVENNKEWFEISREKSSDRLNVVFADTESDYLAAGAGRKFNVIVIDGVYRHRCADMIPNALDKNGLVILDNSDWYPETARVLRERHDLLQVDFHGFGPINNYTWTTSLFFSRFFLCRPSGDRLPNYSLGALRQLADGQNLSMTAVD